ncbi:hypothetical protein BCO18442_04050 [Burkholderia contaminans]|nr:hypothetical protein BCO18442_04050 [Burkholderia contaminans]
MRAAISLASAGITNFAHVCSARRDWHPLAALGLVLLLAETVAPSWGG